MNFHSFCFSEEIFGKISSKRGSGVDLMAKQVHLFFPYEKYDPLSEFTCHFLKIRSTFHIYMPLLKNTIHFSDLSTNLSKNLWEAKGKEAGWLPEEAH
jgi:hypothetical protein